MVILSKWSSYQLLIIIGFTALLIVNNIFAEQLAKTFSFVNSFIEPSLVVYFFTVILIIWGFAITLLLQEKKGKPLFVHKVWRIMPAILGVILILSVAILITLGVTVLSDLPPGIRWVLDLSVIYFLSLFYFLTLTIMLRYGKPATNKDVIIKSANITVLLILIVYFFFPSII